MNQPRTKPPQPCAEDALIREFGFSIAERPNHGPAIWMRADKSYSHGRALAIAQTEEKLRQEKLELDKLNEGKR